MNDAGNTITMMISASTNSPKKTERTAAKRRIMISGFLNWPINWRKAASFFSRTTSLGPYDALRRCNLF